MMTMTMTYYNHFILKNHELSYPLIYKDSYLHMATILISTIIIFQ